MSQITNQIFDKILEEFQKDNTKKKINNNIIDPILLYIYNKIYPYALCILLISIIILILSIIILVQNVFSKKS